VLQVSKNDNPLTGGAKKEKKKERAHGRRASPLYMEMGKKETKIGLEDLNLKKTLLHA